VWRERRAARHKRGRAGAKQLGGTVAASSLVHLGYIHGYPRATGSVRCGRWRQHHPYSDRTHPTMRLASWVRQARSVTHLSGVECLVGKCAEGSPTAAARHRSYTESQLRINSISVHFHYFVTENPNIWAIGSLVPLWGAGGLSCSILAEESIGRSTTAHRQLPYGGVHTCSAATFSLV